MWYYYEKSRGRFYLIRFVDSNSEIPGQCRYTPWLRGRSGILNRKNKFTYIRNNYVASAEEDWWWLGIFAYEEKFGVIPPFCETSPSMILWSEINSQTTIKTNQSWKKQSISLPNARRSKSKLTQKFFRPLPNIWVKRIFNSVPFDWSGGIMPSLHLFHQARLVLL